MKKKSILLSSLFIFPLMTSGLLSIAKDYDLVDFTINKAEAAERQSGSVSTWDGLKSAVKSASKNAVIILSGDIYTSKYSERVVADGKNITVDLNGYSIMKNESDVIEKNGHIFEIQGDSDFRLIDSFGGGTIQGGCGKNGGAINIHDGSTCTIENVHFLNNRAGIDGGAIFNRGHLIMKDCLLRYNIAKDTGGGIYNAGDGWFDLDNVEICYNTAENDGGGLNIQLDNDCTMRNCNIHHNESLTEDGGAFAIDDDSDKLRIYNTSITYNKCPDDGGAICIEQGDIEFYGCDISYNSANFGGAIYADDTFVIKDDGYGTTTIKYNKAIDNDGGAIFSKANIVLNYCDISYNSAKWKGGGVCVKEDECRFDGGIISYNTCTDGHGGGVYIDDGYFVMSNGSITYNEASYGDGGGIAITDGTLTMHGGLISHNHAFGYGGGVAVYPFTDHVYISNNPRVIDNYAPRGKDLYMSSVDTLELDGKLTDGAMISFTLIVGEEIWKNYWTEKAYNTYDKDAFEELTSDYSKYHGEEDPNKYFVSAEGYQLTLSDGEVFPSDVIGEYDPTSDIPELNMYTFIPWNEQIETNYNSLTGVNWLAGVSGERKISEINVPVTHDSAMKDVAAATDCIGSRLDYFDDAVTHYQYIYEQLESGVRGLDLRLSNKRVWKKGRGIGDQSDDGENLYICHGENNTGGTYYAKDPQTGYPLNFLKVLEWSEKFLEAHPTEFILFSFTAECQHSYDKPITYQRLYDILEERTKDINPTTGEPFFYLQDGVFPKPYNDWPLLKDVRGKILIRYSDKNDYGVDIGGFRRDDSFGGTYYVPEQNGDFSLTATHKIEDVEEFASREIGKRDIPTDASSLIDNDTGKPVYFKTGTNCTGGEATITGQPSKHPYILADRVNAALFGLGKVFSKEKAGKYIGWVSSDAVTGSICANVYETNFSNNFEYKTVTVESGKAEIPTQTFKLLKGSEITIPGYIYDYPQSEEGGYFNGWTSGDTPYEEGTKYIVNDDVTFKANWSSVGIEKTRVSINWKDVNNKDELRDDTIQINVNGIQFNVNGSNNWSRGLPVLADSASSITASWDKASSNVDGPSTYRYEVSGDNANGWVVTLIHTPTDTIDIDYTINFKDIGSGVGTSRPDFMTYQLMVKNTEIPLDTIVFDTTSDVPDLTLSDKFINIPIYKDGEKIQYDVVFKDATGPNADLTKYNIIPVGFYRYYTLKNLADLNVNIYWDEIAKEDRPDTLNITLTDTNTSKEFVDTIEPNKVDASQFTCSYHVVADDVIGDDFIIDYHHYSLSTTGLPTDVYLNVFVEDDLIYAVISKNNYTDEVSMVIQMIDDIGIVGAQSGEKIDRADFYFNLLKEEDRAKVTNAKKLEDAKETFSNIDNAAAISVLSLINNIGDVEYNAVTELKIRVARNRYDRLNDEQKSDVVNYYRLLNAEALFDILDKKHQKSMSDVQKVIDAINDIAEVNYDSETYSDIDEARQGYELLTDTQKVLIHNYNVLVESEAEYFIKYFLSVTEFASKGGEVKNELEDVWAELLDAWNSLSIDTRTYILENSDKPSIASFFDRYIFIMSHYGTYLTPFEGCPEVTPIVRTPTYIILLSTSIAAVFALMVISFIALNRSEKKYKLLEKEQ